MNTRRISLRSKSSLAWDVGGVQRLSRKKQGSWAAPQSLARGPPEDWMEDGVQHSSTRLVTAASTAPFASVLPVTFFLNPHAQSCLNLCCVTSKWISPLLYIKKPVSFHGSVLCGTLWSSRNPQGRLASGDWHHGVDGEAKYLLQKFPRLPKMCFHHTVNKRYFIPLLKYSQTH